MFETVMSFKRFTNTNWIAKPSESVSQKRSTYIKYREVKKSFDKINIPWWPWLKEHKGCDLQSACDSSHLEESRNLGYYFYIICDLRYNSNPLICLLVRFLGRFHRLANPSIHLLILFLIHVYVIKKVLSLLCAKEEWTASLIYSDEGRRDKRKSKKVVSILSLNILL